MRLAQSLKQLYETSSSSLTDLSVSSLPHPSLMETLLNACPNLRSFSMEIHPIAEYHRPQQRQPLQSAGYSGSSLFPPAHPNYSSFTCMTFINVTKCSNQVNDRESWILLLLKNAIKYIKYFVLRLVATFCL